MAFLTQSRLVKYGALVGGVQTVVADQVIFTSAVGTVVETVEQLAPLVPAGQRPPSANFWMYRVQQRVQRHLLPTIRGVDPRDGRLVLDVDFWETAAQQTGGTPPLRRCTFRLSFAGKRLAVAGQELLAQIDAYLIRAHFNPAIPADDRDVANGGTPFPTTTDPAADTLGLLTNPQITARDGVALTLPATWVG